MLIRGKEDLFADRATARLRKLALKQDPHLESSTVSAAEYRVGDLATYTSPSLFGESRLIMIPDLEATNQFFADDLLQYLSAPTADVWMVLRHDGSNRGRGLVDKLKKLLPLVPVEPLTQARQKLELVSSDVRDANRRIEPQAAQFLVDALGNEVAELAGAVSQLCAQTDQVITLQQVKDLYGMRYSLSAYEIANSAVQGRVGQAILQLRQAYESGISPVQMVAILAAKLRGIAKVTGPYPGSLGMSPWQAKQARTEGRNWSDRNLALAIQAVAQADEEVKGVAKDPFFAAERAVRKVAELAARRPG